MHNDSQLILVEGIPFSGKTSTAEYIHRQLCSQGRQSRLWAEGDLDHPADFEAVAWLDAAGYAALLARYPQERELLEAHTTRRGEDYLVGYIKMHIAQPEMAPALLDELAARDVYVGLPADEFRRLTLERWQDFATAAQSSDEAVVLECCFLQNAYVALMGHLDRPAEEVREHVRAIAEIIRPLRPQLVFLHRPDAANRLELARQDRPEHWEKRVIGYLIEQGYGQRAGLSGWAGVIAFFEMAQALQLELLDELPLASLVADNSDGDWERLHARISAFLG